MLERAERKQHAARIAELKQKLAQPAFPEALAYLWRAHRRMRRRKGAGEAGPHPIEFPDIQAFETLTRNRLAPWEVELIEALDDAYLGAVAEHQRQEREQTAPADDPDGARAIPRRTVTRKRGGEQP
jgi:hypothetical protein